MLKLRGFTHIEERDPAASMGSAPRSIVQGRLELLGLVDHDQKDTRFGSSFHRPISAPPLESGASERQAREPSCHHRSQNRNSPVKPGLSNSEAENLGINPDL